MPESKVSDEDFLKVAMVKSSSSVWFDLDKSEQLEHFRESLKRLSKLVKNSKKSEAKASKVELSKDGKQIWDWYILGLNQKLPETAKRLRQTKPRIIIINNALKLHRIKDLRIALRAFFRDEWVERWNTKNAWDIRYAIGSFPQKGDMAEGWLAKSEKPNINSGEDGFVENVLSRMPGYGNK